MHSRLYAYVAPIALLLGTSGCVQATRHSNTMVFGTNTSVGLKVGTSATQVPSITVGYDRQEAVVMPLVANTEDDGSIQKPCPINEMPVGHSAAPSVVHPCLLVGVNGSASDSYSVLASFGASFDGSADQTGAKAKGGLAQYFATGMAAQLLAASGGASVVSVGEAAIESAKHQAPVGETARALFNNQTAVARGTVLAQSYTSFQGKLIAFVKTLDDSKLADQLKLFEADAGALASIVGRCQTKAACVTFIENNQSYALEYSNNAQKVDKALAARLAVNN